MIEPCVFVAYISKSYVYYLFNISVVRFMLSRKNKDEEERRKEKNVKILYICRKTFTLKLYLLNLIAHNVCMSKAVDIRCRCCYFFFFIFLISPLIRMCVCPRNINMWYFCPPSPPHHVQCFMWLWWPLGIIEL